MMAARPGHRWLGAWDFKQQRLAKRIQNTAPMGGCRCPIFHDDFGLPARLVVRPSCCLI
jgi:hypothetical protein